jgi:hypothetical protein
MVGVVFQRFAVPRNRKLGGVSQGGQPGHGVANSSELRFNQKTLAIAKVLYPSMPYSIGPVWSAHESCIVSHVQQLSPSPKSKIVAVSLFSFLEVFRRLPVVSLSKLFFVGNAFAASEKSANVANRVTLYGQWLTDISPDRESGVWTLTVKEWLRHPPSVRVISLWDDLCNHQLSWILSHQSLCPGTG